VVGLNRTTSTDITLWFKNDEIERGTFKPKTNGTVDPIKDVDIANAKLKGFNWQYDKRPKSVTDLHAGRKEPPLDFSLPLSPKEKKSGTSKNPKEKKPKGK
jgi:hypothetical protein